MAAFTLGDSADGTRLQAGYNNKTIRIWNVESRTSVGEFAMGHDERLLSRAFASDPDYLVTSGQDGFIRLWKIDSDRLVLELDVKSPDIAAVTLTEDLSRIVAAVVQKVGFAPTGVVVRRWDLVWSFEFDTGK